MAKILAISSQTVFGPVGLSASVPALQALGHDVLALPSIILSHHPGHGRPVGQRTPATLMRDMLEGLKKVGALKNIDAVLTGYFADAEQIAVAEEAIIAVSAEHILVDPVIGDHGALYVPRDVAAAIRDRLLPLATIITPNLFELHWLSDEADLDRAVRKLGRSETIVTSVPQGDELATHLHVEGRKHVRAAARLSGVPHGTGDYLAGLYLAHRATHDPATAFDKAMTGLERVIAASAGSSTLKVARITAGL